MSLFELLVELLMIDAAKAELLAEQSADPTMQDDESVAWSLGTMEEDYHQVIELIHITLWESAVGKNQQRYLIN